MSIYLEAISKGHPVALAPMSGVTDLAFRRMARRFGASLLVTEMVASERYVAGEDEESLRSQSDTAGLPFVVQLAGCEASWMARAAAQAELEGAAAIDINMGCPAKRVVGGYAGSALMRDLDHAATLIEAVIRAVSVPVSVKMRLGWDDTTINAPELALRAQDLGVQLVSVHGRTRCQFYRGTADWGRVGEVVRAVAIPVLVNGDILNREDARDAVRRSGAAGVMIGRSAIGQPWIFADTRSALADTVSHSPTIDEKRQAILEQLRLSTEIYGLKKGILQFRKHLLAYLKLSGAAGTHIAAASQAAGTSLIADIVSTVFCDLSERLAA